MDDVAQRRFSQALAGLSFRGGIEAWAPCMENATSLGKLGLDMLEARYAALLAALDNGSPVSEWARAWHIAEATRGILGLLSAYEERVADCWQRLPCVAKVVAQRQRARDRRYGFEAHLPANLRGAENLRAIREADVQRCLAEMDTIARNAREWGERWGINESTAFNRLATLQARGLVKSVIWKDNARRTKLWWRA